ncbi:hypothetical protein PO909_003491, partial [Leuciscus waleckii]
MNWMSWFSFSSAQSRMNFCTETVFPMPATPFVSTVLMGLSCPELCVDLIQECW